MKIALCISGMMRTWEACAPTIVEYVKQDLDVDTFISTWDVYGRNPVWWEVSQDNTPVDYNLINKYKKDLNIKKVLIDTYEGSDLMKWVDKEVKEGGRFFNRTGERCNPYNFIPMIKKIEQAHYLMLDNPTSYDVIVKMRADLMFSGPVSFSQPTRDTIYMPTHECWGPLSLNDQFLYGGLDVMTTHASLFRALPDLYDATNTLHPESLLAIWYNSFNINVVKETIPYRIER